MAFAQYCEEHPTTEGEGSDLDDSIVSDPDSCDIMVDCEACAMPTIPESNVRQAPDQNLPLNNHY